MRAQEFITERTVENFNGLEITLQDLGDDMIEIQASADGRELGNVTFVQDGHTLLPQDLHVDERYRGQGIAAAMYDYAKSQGYQIRRSGQQTDAGAGFWDKHRPEQNVWEQGMAEGSDKNVVKSVRVGNFRHDLVDTGMGWQVRIYNGDELYDTGMSKNSEQKGLSALEDAVAYTEKQINAKRQGMAETVNPTVFQRGFEKSKSILDGKYTLIAKNGRMLLHQKPWEPSDQFRIEVKTNKGALVGWVNFENIDDNLEALDLNVDVKHRRKGIATEIYRFARELGNTIKPSNKQTALGKAMWQGFNKKEQGMAEDMAQKNPVIRTVADFYINDVGHVDPEPLDDYVAQARDLLSQVPDQSLKAKIADILKQAYKNPTIQGGVITTVGALLAGGVLASAQKFGLSPTQTNMALQAILNTVIPTMVSRVNGRNWRDTIKYTLASAGIGTGIAAVTENFKDGKNPQDQGDSARHGIPKNATIAQLKQIRSSKTASPRKKQLAHWQINMRQGRAKAK